MVSVELDLPLERWHVLTVDLEGHGPKVSLPNEAGLCVLQTELVLVVHALRAHEEVEISDVEPEADHSHCHDWRPDLEPALRVHVVQGPITVSFEGSPHREPVRGVFFGQDWETVDNVRHLQRHSAKNEEKKITRREWFAWSSRTWRTLSFFRAWSIRSCSRLSC